MACRSGQSLILPDDTDTDFATAPKMWESVDGSHLILAGTAKFGPRQAG
ncbi:MULTISPECIES: hypothetical protein [unclassified Rhodococcus (in: high G+C Gram-positive bacteria)]|nr:MULTISPECIES: hypothetical protein [unclassified Rhodococcus (in: high G+C Gram-positive bacteria)]